MVEIYYPSEPHILNWLKSFILPSDVVLDVGSGDGRYKNIGAREYYGLDSWEKADPHYLIDLNDYDLPTDKDFDVILLIDILEHIEKPRSKEILRQAIKLAKRAVVVFTPLYFDDNSEAHDDEKGFHYKNGNILHRCMYELKDFHSGWKRVILPSTNNHFMGYKLRNKSIIVGQVCMYNEVITGNLERCLDNLSKYCDHIVIYDDKSTDNSVEVARKYTDHIICGETNNQLQEIYHKQLLLDKAIELGATHAFWLDCDEVLERAGTDGGLRELCDNWPDGVDAYSFRETNLWRSQNHVRIDSLFDVARFVRLWKITPGIKFNVVDGVHLKLYPETVKNIEEAPFSVVHYGFCDYKKMMVKIGVQGHSAELLRSIAPENWLLNETQCSCYKLANDIFPSGCLPPDIWPRPLPKKIHELKPYDEVEGEQTFPLYYSKSNIVWNILHGYDYHGNYETIHTRNKNIIDNNNIDSKQRACLFRFDPAGKVVFDIGCGSGSYMLDCIINGASRVYGFEVSVRLIDSATRSYKTLGIDPDKYRFIHIVNDPAVDQMADVIYCLAVFMHLHWWQNKRYMQWFRESLNDDGDVFIQTYQKDGLNMCYNGNDNVLAITFERELEKNGFDIVNDSWYFGDTDYPLWHLYHCKKR